jgi:cyclohexanecarboxylate-CoA ligase
MEHAPENLAKTADMRPKGMMLSQTRVQHEVVLGHWPNRLLTDYLADTVRRDPAKAALITHQNETISYGELDQKSDNIAANLAGLGVTKGDVVSFQLPNWWQFVAIHLACLKLGAISNPLMPIFRAREMAYMVAFAESKVLIVPKEFQKFNHEKLGRDLLDQIPSLAHLFVIDGKDEASFERNLLKKPDNPVLPKSTLTPNDVVLLLFTSGTTGKPKGVMHTSNTLLTSSLQVASRMALGKNDIGFMPAPFAHMIGFNFGMNMSIVLGIPLVMLDVWNPEVALELIARHRVSYAAGSTPFMDDLAEAQDAAQHDLSQFKTFLTAGAPIMETVIEKVTDKLGISIVPGWGMTEVVQATACQPIAKLDAPLTDGAPFPGNDVQVVDQSGAKVAVGQEGHLQFRGSTLFVGYFKQPRLYQLDKDGWFDTGDLARMDEAGNIRITGRDKDILVRGGENIPVLEVESLICQMEIVCDVALVGMPDDRLGERGCVFLVLKAGRRMTLAQLAKYLKSQGLAKQYFPERLEIISQMPRTASGKIQKFILRQRAAEFVEIDGLISNSETLKM